MRLLVGGVGYGCLRDLSFGPIVIERLRAREWPAGMEVEDLSYNPVAVTQKLQEERFDKVIVIGATERGRVLGHLYRFPYDGALPPPEEIQQRVGEAVTGVISVDNLLTVCAQFNALPPVVEVIELEPVDEGWGEGLTPEAVARVEEVAAIIREEARLVELEREVRRIPGCGCDCHESSADPCNCGCECCAPVQDEDAVSPLRRDGSVSAGSRAEAPVKEDAVSSLRWRDEVLQIMYWMQGERLGTDVDPADLVPFLSRDDPAVQRWMEALVEQGLLVRVDGHSRYRLTDSGYTEAQRRFVDDFAPLLRQGHGVCNDPECPCHLGEPCLTTGSAAEGTYSPGG